MQIVQAWGPEAGELKVFQRTPNLTVPSHKRDLTNEEQEKTKRYYPELFRYRETSFAGFTYDWVEKNTFDDTAEDREAFYEEKWNAGGFRFWLSLYKDNLFNAEANKKSYDFWAKKIRDRMEDPKKRDILAPLVMPHFFGIKRPCLEFNYYEQFNRPNVDVVDIKDNAIKDFDETGIILEDGTHHELDVIAIATGFVCTLNHLYDTMQHISNYLHIGHCYWRYDIRREHPRLKLRLTSIALTLHSNDTTGT